MELGTPGQYPALRAQGLIGVHHPSRLCFAAHAANAENLYSGGFNMAHSTQITVDVELAEAVHTRIYAVQLQRVVIDADGNILSSLD